MFELLRNLSDFKGYYYKKLKDLGIATGLVDWFIAEIRQPRNIIYSSETNVQNKLKGKECTILEMEHADIEFLAEKQPVKIVPNFSLEKIYFISGDFGPFQPGLPLEVPLWLAISLKQQQKCRIHPPEWLNTEDLEAKKEEENTSDIFTELPSPHFREVANLLLTHATDNVQNADEIRTLVKDIWDIRAAKLRSNVDKFVKLQAGHARLDNLTQMEINTIRPFLTGSLDHLHKLRMSQTIAERNIPSQ